MNFNIEFYRDKETNRCYIEEFLYSLDIKAKSPYIKKYTRLGSFYVYCASSTDHIFFIKQSVTLMPMF